MSMIKGLAVSWNGIYNTLMKIPFVFYMIFIALTFWLIGSSFFENWNLLYAPLILPYIVMMLAFFIWSRTRSTGVHTSSFSALPSFVMGFLGTWMVMTVLIKVGVLKAGALEPTQILPMIIFQICVVATAEEVAFRGVLLPMLSRAGLFFAIIANSALFAMWHLTAYGIRFGDVLSFNVISLFIAFIIGVLLSFVAVSRFGLAAAIGCHAAYNLCVIGAITIL